MTNSFFLSVREDVVFSRQGADQAVLQYGSWSTTFRHLPSGTRAALERLIKAGEQEDKLTEIILETENVDALAQFYYYLHRLTQWRLLRRSARINGVRLATLVPVSFSSDSPSQSIAPDQQYKLSRFVYARVEKGEAVLESPLCHGRIVLHDWRATALTHMLAQPQRLEELNGQIPGLTIEAVDQLMTLLLNARMLSEINDAGQAVQDEEPSLQSWEFHDLLFHSRSRKGRHDSPVGSTYRLVGQLDPPPALKPPSAHEVIELSRPNLERLKCEDPPFALIQETRRSIRQYDAKPITARQLGEFLYRVGRVTECAEQEITTPRGAVRMEFAHRPYPGGGALYELELYTAINACANLAGGLYHYAPRDHRLEKLSDRTQGVDELLLGASQATTIPSKHLQVLIVITARFQRFSWKYESMAYALILKNVGVLYQTMYLVATAMGLAPCGVGCGDADLFSRAAGTDYYDETSVGEFLLGSKPRRSRKTL